MSVSTVNIILERIKAASPESMIAVFALNEPRDELLNAVFDDTGQTQDDKQSMKSLYVGSYHGKMPGKGMKQIREELMAATMGVL